MIDLNIQIDLIVFSILFGIIYHAGIIFLNKYLYQKWLNIIGSFGYVLLFTILYFYNIEKIAYGIFHPYSVILIIVGYYLFKPIEKIMKKWYIIFGDIMTLQAKRRLLVFGTISIIIIAAFIYTTSNYIKTLNSLNKEIDKLNTLLADLQVYGEDLKVEINKLQDPEYIAKYARENYDYSKEDEIIIKINETQKNIDDLNEKEYGNKVFLVIFAMIFMAMIFIYICIKSLSLKHQKKKK